MSTPLVGVVVSPTPSLPLTPARKKREVTPSADQSVPNQMLLLSTSDVPPNVEISVRPFFAPRQLFPRGTANVVHRYTHAPGKQENEKATWNTRHILLPFNLQDPDTDIFKGDVRALLYNIFPGTTNVTEARYRSHLLFQVKELPKGPWPLTVGGVPITIVDEGNRGRALIFPRQSLGNFAISLCREGYDFDNLSDKVLRELAADVNIYFRENLPGIWIVELMATCERTFYIVLGTNINIGAMRSKLPGKIANRPVGYLNENELHRPRWTDRQARRDIEPQPLQGVVDNTTYDILRPGVMICSTSFKEHAHPATLSTTSGVLVQNPVGDPFMTAASQGIGKWETVWQADCSDKIIGRAVVEISCTDISLVELNKDIKFDNQTFESSSGVDPNFDRLVTSGDKVTWPLCYLNSPYTGNMEGNIVQKSVKLEPSTHPTQDNLRYVVYDWAYMGQEEGNQNKVRPPDGTCGSVIWDDEGIILGFYQYYIAEGSWAGFSVSVSASEVVEVGYSLVK